MLSVIIPVYNVAAFASQCLDSVLGQTLRDLEVICIDDGSTDGSYEVLQRYALRDARMKIIRQKNSGPGAARNKGLGEARGKWVAFMDPDDFYPSPDTLAHMLTAAEREQVDICGGSLKRFVNGVMEKDATNLDPEYIFESDGLMKYSDYQFDYGYWRFLYRKSFLDKNGLRFPDYRRQQDPPFMVRAFSLAGQFYALKEPTYVYRREVGKQPTWDESRAWGFYSGVRDVVKLSTEYKLERLFAKELERLRTPWFLNAIGETLRCESVYRRVSELLADIVNSPLYASTADPHLDAMFDAVNAARGSDVIVSVVVPVYNVEKYLARCLDSILAQSFPWFEVLCVDDGGTDNSTQILEDYAKGDSRVKVLHKKNGGLSSARNFALPHVRGSYVMFVDSDDWIDTNTLAESVRRMVRDVDIVIWGVKLVDDGVGPNDPCLVDGQKYHVLTHSGLKKVDVNLIASTPVSAWNKLFKVSILRESDISFAEGRIFEDNDFTCAYMTHCRSAWYIPEYYYFYSQRPGSIMQRFYKEGSPRVVDALYVFDRLYRHLEKCGTVLEFQMLLKRRFRVQLDTAVTRAPESCRLEHLKTAEDLAREYSGEFGKWCRYHIAEMRERFVPEEGAPELSVIVPVHNAAPYLRECLDSILGQDVRLEVICVDDCSTDSSASICAEYAQRDSRVKLLRNETNLFAGRTRNRGIKAAKGRYVAFLDADDRAEPGAYKAFLEVAYREDADIVRGTARAFDFETGADIPDAYYRQKNVPDGFCEHATNFHDCYKQLVLMPPVPWIGICKQSLVACYEMTFNDLPLYEDVAFFFDLISRGERIVFLRRDIVAHRWNNPDSMLGRTAKNFKCILQSVLCVQRHLREQEMGAAEWRAAMDFSLNTMSAWLDKALKADRDSERLVQETVACVRQLDLSPWNGEQYETKWFGRLVATLGIEKTVEDPMLVPIVRRVLTLKRGAQSSASEGRAGVRSLAIPNEILNTVCFVRSSRIDCLFSLADVKSVSAVAESQGVVILAPKWMVANGRSGLCVVCHELTGRMSLNCQGSGKIEIALRGQDVRLKNDEKKHIPFWIDYVSVMVRGKESLTGRTRAWHDEQHRFTIEVKAGETVEIAVETIPHKYERAVLRDMLLKAKLPVAVEEKNVDGILDDPALAPFIRDERDVALERQQKEIERQQKEIVDLKTDLGKKMVSGLHGKAARNAKALQRMMTASETRANENLNRALEAERRAGAAEREAAMARREVARREAAVRAASTGALAKKEKDLLDWKIREVEELHHSFAYRTGMIVTAPLRAIKRALTGKK